MTSSAATADRVRDNRTTHANPNGTVAPETIATAIIDSPAGLLEQAQIALDDGDIQQFARRAHQAADGAMRAAARRLGYSTSTESDVHIFIRALDGFQELPPDADTATVNAWFDAHSHVTPNYWPNYAVVEGVRAIACLPDKKMLESEDVDYSTERCDIMLEIVTEFVDAIATATVPEPTP